MNVLVAIEADRVFEDVLATLRWCVRLDGNDKVLLVHAAAVVPLPQSAGASDTGWADAIRAEEDATSARVLDEASRQLATWGIEAERLSAPAGAAKEILRLARERQSDLIVIGARGRAGAFSIGSVSQKVKALADTDVLVVKRGTPLDGRPLRVLIASDGSLESLRGVQSFIRKTRSAHAEVLLLHALNLPPFTVWNVFAEQDSVEPASLPAPLRDRAQRALCEASGLLRSHAIEFKTEIRKGQPADEILAAADRLRADLVVMGARGLTAFQRLLVGSVTQRVVRHGLTSVLVAH